MSGDEGPPPVLSWTAKVLLGAALGLVAAVVAAVLVASGGGTGLAAVLVSLLAIVAMIVLGNLLAGRTTPDVAPSRRPGRSHPSPPGAGGEAALGR